MAARNLYYIDNYKALLNNNDEIQGIRQNIIDGDVYVVRNMYSKSTIAAMIEYLTGIGKYSLPNYHAIEMGAPNFHRMNNWDKRAYVKGCFHQFSFFPWNQDVFNLFELAQDVYYLKNLLSGLPRDKFMGEKPQDGCVSRLSFQFYPKGKGGLNKHADPVDHHQLAVPTLTMSKKGIDFVEGGAYVDSNNGSRIYVDEISDVGDVTFFNARLPHGVENIDPSETINWTDFKGRWMLLFAINKVISNNQIADAVDLSEQVIVSK
jgi:hypothetical protein